MVYSIQYMRAIAAIMVLLTHVASKSQIFGGSFLGDFLIGNMGVDIFFIISGYIMCMVGTKYSALIFLINRAKRILPLYWFLTTVALCVFLIAPDKVNSSSIGATSIIGSYSLVPIWGNYLVQNGWTLSYEFVFYIIFSAGIIFSGSARLQVPMAIILLLVIAGLYGLEVTILTNPMMLEFVLGMLAFVYGHRVIPKVKGCWFIIMALAYLILLAHFELDIGRMPALGVAALMIFLGMLRMELFFVERRSSAWSRLMKSLGDSSYSLYLCHPFALAALSLIMSRTGIVTSGLVAIIIMIVYALIAGYFCHRFIERGLDRLIRRKY